MDEFIQSSIDILLPVMESAVTLGAEYCKACGRTTLTAEDQKYSMRYAAMHVTGKQIGTLFPEIYDEESDSDEDDIETVDEEDEPFTRYSGGNELMNKVNEAHDSWDSWTPISPAEILLKTSIDKVHDL
jgi:hypothetical protein